MTVCILRVFDVSLKPGARHVIADAWPGTACHRRGFDPVRRGKPCVMSDQSSAQTHAPLEPLGDPDDTGDFADEHDHTIVDSDEPDSGEEESPDRYSGGLDREGPP